jgi:hypothetical protein
VQAVNLGHATRFLAFVTMIQKLLGAAVVVVVLWDLLLPLELLKKCSKSFPSNGRTYPLLQVMTVPLGKTHSTSSAVIL